MNPHETVKYTQQFLKTIGIEITEKLGKDVMEFQKNFFEDNEIEVPIRMKYPKITAKEALRTLSKDEQILAIKNGRSTKIWKGNDNKDYILNITKTNNMVTVRWIRFS